MKKFKMAVSIGLALSLLLILICSACAEQGAEETPIILRWNRISVPSGYDWEQSMVTAGRIEARTEGKVKLELYSVGQLSSPLEAMESVRSGVADIGDVIPGYNPGMFPLFGITEVPLIFSDWTDKVQVLEDLREKYIDAEFEANGLKLIALTSLPELQVFSTKRLGSLSDFRGVQISSAYETICEALEKIGFASVRVPGAETYLSLQKGVIDAATQNFMMAKATKYEEVCNYVTVINLSNVVFSYSMNYQVWDSMPSDLREIVEEELLAHRDRILANSTAENEAARQFFIDEGLEIITLSNEDYELIMQKISPVLDEWIDKQEEAGIEKASKFAEDYLEIRDKYMSK